MTKLSWAAVALGAALALGGVNTAKADTTYALDFTGAGGLATASLGTLTINQVSSTEIDYTVHLTQGDFWNGGKETFFAYVTGSIDHATVSNTTAGTSWSTPTIVNLSSNPYDGLGKDFWNVGTNCTSGQPNCGTDLTVKVFGSTAPGSTPLGIGFVTVGGSQIYAGLDISCQNPGPCSAGSPVAATGIVGATLVPNLTVPVPAPFVGAGLPGLIAACAGLVVFARRRRQRFA
jgi:hypothetical protein